MTRIILLYLTLILYGCTMTPEETDQAQLSKILINQDKYTSGDRVLIATNTDLKHLKSAFLLASNGLNASSIEAVKSNKQLVFDLTQFCRKSGRVSLSLIVNNILLDTQHIFIVANNPDKNHHFTGPLSLELGLDESSLIITQPVDKYGNSMQSGKKVQISKNNIKSNNAIQNLIAFEEIYDQGETGKILISSQMNQAFGEEQEVKVTSTKPYDIEIHLIEKTENSDGRQSIVIQSKPIRDKFDNTVVDGTMIAFVIEEKDRLSKVYKSLTVNGIAKVHIDNPNYESNYSISATSQNGVKSNEVKLTFSAYVKSANISFEAKKQQLSIGPIVGATSQYVPNDYPAKLLLTLPSGKTRKLSIQIEDGYSKFNIKNISKEKGLHKAVLLIDKISKTIEFEVNE